MRSIALVASVAMLSAVAAHAGQLDPAARSTTATVRVYAAGSLRGALTDVARVYEARTGNHVVFTFRSSGLLRQQIEHGADADVFASADMGQPERLARHGGWQAPVAFARNRLCLLTQRSLHVTPANALATLLRPDVRVGTSTPDADPSGDYAWQIFRKADRVQHGAYATLDAKALKLVGGGQRVDAPAGQNVLAWLMTHERLGVFVTYCPGAGAAALAQPELASVPLPPDLAVTGSDGLTLREPASPAARAFVAMLRGATGRQALRKAGFDVP